MSAKKQAWQQFCNEIEATYVQGEVLKSDRIEATFQNWQILYDSFIIPFPHLRYTRIRAPFLAKSDFKFRITKKTFFDKIKEKFGKSDVETGDSRIDNAFVIQSNSAEKIKSLFSEEDLKNLLLGKVDSHFEFTHGYKGTGREFPNDCDGLCLVVLYEGKDIDKLKLIYNLFGEVLTSLLESDDICDEPIDEKI
jgi:hypothetical protein